MVRKVGSLSVEIHRSGWVLMGVLVAFGCKDLGWRYGWAGGLLVVGSLLAHELAHVAAARWLGVPVYGIGIKIMGAYTRRRYASRPGHDALIAAAGPLASLVLVLATVLIPKVGLWVAVWNACVVMLNVLPVPGSDGERIVRSLFWPEKEKYQVVAEKAEGLARAA